jgi:hypothetical protein
MFDGTDLVLHTEPVPGSSIKCFLQILQNLEFTYGKFLLSYTKTDRVNHAVLSRLHTSKFSTTKNLSK